jgi:serine/threonine protein kinase/tetratricopeptide (TPR) repeat protein
MATTAAESNLLFGLLALQNGLIDQDQLVAAFRAWTRDRSRALADYLAARGDLDADQRAGVEAMVGLHIKKHGDAGRSLAALPAGRSTRESLAAIGDPVIEHTLTQLASGSDDDPDRTASYAVGTATADGQRYRVLRPHARGGLGAVFVALDAELHREVALKQILDAHADDPVSRQRFLLEAEVTGGLEHPGIVPVYGLGTHGDGRPFYAMRFIRGDSLKQAIEHFHADARMKTVAGGRSLELRKLLRRFLDVCNAIGYAHSRGVLHRDIKPGNIIVGRHGETLVVDWGLAKARGRADSAESADERPLVPSSASGSAETLPGSALGTPAYMSPEQARGDLEAMGPRSDVYSLGATLYCLLTGRPPVADDDLGAVLRAVQAGEFPPPRRLDAAIDPALEAVCLKAMALRPEDRYAMPRSLAEDIERWMADEPVSAWREPLARRARRWAWRNRTAVAAVAVALVAGVVGLGAVAGVQARANSELNDAYRETSQALEETKREKTKADEALAQAEAVSTFLVEGFRSPDPSLAGSDVKVADLLDRATERLNLQFTGSTATKGALLHALGRTYMGLGLYHKAVTILAQALEARQAASGADHPDTLATRSILALASTYAGRVAEALALHESTLERRKAVLGPDHPDTLGSRGNLAFAYQAAGRMAEALALHESTLERREAVLGPDHPDTLGSRGNVATAYGEAGRHSEAIALHQKTVKLMESKLGPDHPQTLTCRNNLAVAYWRAGRTAEAIAMDEATLKLREAKLGPDHPDTLQTRRNLANGLFDEGRLSESIALNEGTLKLTEARLGVDHPVTLINRNNLANAYGAAGRLPESIALHESTLRLREAKLGPDHPDTLMSRFNLGLSYFNAGRFSDAAAMHEATLKPREAKLGADHPDTHRTRNELASTYEALGRSTEALGRSIEAERLFREVLAHRRKTVEPGSPDLASALFDLGRNLLNQSRWPEAEPLLREAAAIREKATPGEWPRFNVTSLLGASLFGQGRYAESESALVAGFEGMKALEATIPDAERSRLREAAERVVRLYEAWGKPEQSVAWKARVGMSDLPADVFARP